MRPGSTIIDLAAATGGNTELTRNNETVMHKGVSIIGDSSLPASMPSDASKLYGKNLLNFLQLITSKEGGLQINWEDDLVTGACIARDGQLSNERVKQQLQTPAS
ncbi:MAG TPA: NAD(P)(+) transhydrogenase (Re/Si-specific) subunit alpha, partial [Chitinophagaceae bacterium]|nr:NAD(P)(+) transhydrogenase (Re/Si-specific) subunit alpha [Chitinophagaceae bacterium]